MINKYTSYHKRNFFGIRYAIYEAGKLRESEFSISYFPYQQFFYHNSTQILHSSELSIKIQVILRFYNFFLILGVDTRMHSN